MGFYNVTETWRKIVSNAEYVTLNTTGKVRVFIGEAGPTDGWDAGVILRGESSLQAGDVGNQGGSVFVKGAGEVTLQADPGAQKAPSDDGTDPGDPGDGETPPSGVYSTTGTWRKIVSDAQSSVSLTTTGAVRVFIGEANPSNGWDAGAILRGACAMVAGDVANQGGNVFVKSEGKDGGKVTLISAPGAKLASADA